MRDGRKTVFTSLMYSVFFVYSAWFCWLSCSLRLQLPLLWIPGKKVNRGCVFLLESFFFPPFQTFFLACTSLEFWLESGFFFFFLSRNLIMKEYAIQKICPFVLESSRGNGAYFPKVVPKSRVYSTPGLVWGRVANYSVKPGWVGHLI